MSKYLYTPPNEIIYLLGIFHLSENSIRKFTAVGRRWVVYAPYLCLYFHFRFRYYRIFIFLFLSLSLTHSRIPLNQIKSIYFERLQSEKRKEKKIMRNGVASFLSGWNSLSTTLCLWLASICYRRATTHSMIHQITSMSENTFRMKRMMRKNHHVELVPYALPHYWFLVSVCGSHAQTHHHIHVHLLAGGMCRCASEHWLFSDVFFFLLLFAFAVHFFPSFLCNATSQ